MRDLRKCMKLLQCNAPIGDDWGQLVKLARDRDLGRASYRNLLLTPSFFKAVRRNCLK